MFSSSFFIYIFIPLHLLHFQLTSPSIDTLLYPLVFPPPPLLCCHTSSYHVIPLHFSLPSFLPLLPQPFIHYTLRSIPPLFPSLIFIAGSPSLSFPLFSPLHLSTMFSQDASLIVFFYFFLFSYLLTYHYFLFFIFVKFYSDLFTYQMYFFILCIISVLLIYLHHAVSFVFLKLYMMKIMMGREGKGERFL